MKKIPLTFAVALVFFASIAFAAFPQDYENALKTAKAENKPLLLYFYSRSCPYCTMMDNKTLADKEIAATLKRDFVYLRVDADKPNDLVKQYRISGTPSSWFVDSLGKPLGEIPGYVEARDYRHILTWIKTKLYKEIDLVTYLKKVSGAK